MFGHYFPIKYCFCCCISPINSSISLQGVIDLLISEVIVPFLHPQLPEYFGVTQPNNGLLLHGPPGCGKTTLAHAIANETGVPFYQISAPEVVSGVSGMELIFLSFDNFMLNALSFLFLYRTIVFHFISKGS